MTEAQGRDFNNLKAAMERKAGIGLLDVVNVDGNFTRSSNDEGLLREPGSSYGGADVPDLRFRPVEDEKVLQEFADGKTVKAYRTVQLIDGDFYSPMATKVGGKTTPRIRLGVPEQAEEHPESIKGTKIGKDGTPHGIVEINKGLGKGTIHVAYNPYFHASRTTLNDQFTSAYKRPNLVVVEVEIPESELTSGYRAEQAKDAVGEIPWHSGPVSGLLADIGRPRRVILSRYDKPVRILPYREVAQKIAEQLEGTDIEIPYNTIQPQLRSELERLGVTVSDEAKGSVSEDPDFGKAEYITDQEIERINAKQQEMAQTSEEAKKDYAERMAKKLNTPIRIVTDVNELTHSNKAIQDALRSNKGIYDVKSGEVIVVLPNHRDVEDVAETVFHEVVAHKGLREMVGDENYDAFCDEIYDHLKDELKDEVDRDATRRFMKNPEKGLKDAIREAIDELFGRLSEKGFEDFTRAERSIWHKLKEKVLDAINKFLGTMKLPKWVKLGDNELRYMLWRSHERLKGKDSYVDMARDAAKRSELGLDEESSEYNKAQSERAEIQRVNEKFNNELEQQIAGTLPKEHVYQLGRPGAVLRAANVADLPIELSALRLADKASEGYKNNHPFTLEEIKDLPRAIQQPIAVFDSNTKEGAKVILTELQSNGNNFVAALQVLKSGNGTSLDVDVNSIRSLYPKDKKAGILSWIEKGLMKWVDKDKMKDFLSTQWPDYIASGKEVAISSRVEDAAKIVESFENPKVRGGEFRFRNGNLGIDEVVTKSAISLSQRFKDDAKLKNDVVKAICNNLSHLRKAMAAQRHFDVTTVKSVADLARTLIESGYIHDLSDGAVKDLISAVKNSAGRIITDKKTGVESVVGGEKNYEASVRRVFDLMIDSQLKSQKEIFDKMLSVKAAKLNNSGVKVQGKLDIDGQRIVSTLRKVMDFDAKNIEALLNDAINRMSSSREVEANQAQLDFTALSYAKMYKDAVKKLEDDLEQFDMDLEQAKDDYKNGSISKEDYQQICDETKNLAQKSKIELAECSYQFKIRPKCN
jgi:hypothetical protein